MCVEVEIHDKRFMEKGRGLWQELGLARAFLRSVSSHLPVYQQPQQQAAQSYGGYKEPAAPVSIQRSAPGGGGVSTKLEGLKVIGLRPGQRWVGLRKEVAQDCS